MLSWVYKPIGMGGQGMYKKMIFGALLTVVGLALSISCAAFGRDYNWHDSPPLGPLLGPFCLGVMVLLIGLLICFFEAYFDKK